MIVAHGDTRPDAGFTLIEVIVALALFALIAAAGAALLTTVLDAQRRTAGRLDRLADVERTVAVVTRDLDEIADAPLAGSATGLSFERHRGTGTATVAYRLTKARFERVAGGRPQLLLDGVAGIRWRYFAPASGWQDRWPAAVEQARSWPAAVALDLDVGGTPNGGSGGGGRPNGGVVGAPAGAIHRIVDLPTRPLPPGAVTPP